MPVRSFNQLGPPDLVVPLTITDPNPTATSGWTPNDPGYGGSGLDPVKDYIIQFTSTYRPRAFTLVGGRNVVLYGMRVRMAVDATMCLFQGTGRQQIIHVQDSHLDPNGFETDCFKTSGNADNMIIQIKGNRCETLRGSTNTGHTHADYVQTSGGFSELWIEDGTFTTAFDGLMCQREANVETMTASDFWNVTKFTRTGNIATATVPSTGLVAGEAFGIWGASNDAYNGGFTALSVVGSGATKTVTFDIGDKTPTTLGTGAATVAQLVRFAWGYKDGKIRLNRVNSYGVSSGTGLPPSTALQCIRYGARAAPVPNSSTNPVGVAGYTRINEDQTPITRDWFNGDLLAMNWYSKPPGTQTIDQFVEPDGSSANFSGVRPTLHSPAGAARYIDWPNNPKVLQSSRLTEGVPPVGDFVTVSNGKLSLKDPTAAYDTSSGGGGGALTYVGDYAADTGGGFNESIAMNPNKQGEYMAGGDTWGLRYSADGGNGWKGSMAGFNSVNTPPHGRACFFSKRVATNGLRFYGVGPNGSGGALYYCNPGSLTPVSLDSTNDFGLGLGSGSGTNGTARRPCGQLIDSYVTSGDKEYIFTLTRSGLHMYKNDSTATDINSRISAISGTPINLLTTTNIGTQLRLFVEVLDAKHLVVINWDHHDVTNPDGTHSIVANTTDVYLVTTTATDWATATAANTTATLLTIAPPKGRVYEIHRGKDGVLYAACGYDGVYTVTLNGTGTNLLWTQISGTFSDLLVCTVDAASDGTVWAGQAAGDTTVSYDNSSSGMVTNHSVLKRTPAGVWSFPATASTVKITEFQIGDTALGTGRNWWLAALNTVLSQAAHDCAMIRVDPFNDSKVHISGRAGCWQTRNGGTTWHPAVHGMNGGQTISISHPAPTGPAIRCIGGKNVIAYNTDYWAAISSDDMATAVKGTWTDASGGGTSLSNSAPTTYAGLDGRSYVFTPATSGNPATLTQDGTPIHDAAFQAAIIAPDSMTVTPDSTVLIVQNGGGTFALVPTASGGGGGGGGGGGTFTYAATGAGTGTPAGTRSVNASPYNAAPAATASANRTAINQAITDASAASGYQRVTIDTPGTYQINGYILMKSNMELYVPPGVNVVLKLTTYDTRIQQSAPVLTTNGASNTTVKVDGTLLLDANGIALDGNTQPTVGGVGWNRLSAYVAEIRGGSNNVFDGIDTTNPYTYSIVAVGTDTFAIAHCTTKVTTSGKYNQLDGIHILESTNGDVIYNTPDQKFNNNTDGDDGMVVHTIGAPASDIRIRGNKIRGGDNGAGYDFAHGPLISNIDFTYNEIWGTNGAGHTGNFTAGPIPDRINLSHNNFHDNLNGPSLNATNSTVDGNRLCSSGSLTVTGTGTTHTGDLGCNDPVPVPPGSGGGGGGGGTQPTGTYWDMDFGVNTPAASPFGFDGTVAADPVAGSIMEVISAAPASGVGKQVGIGIRGTALAAGTYNSEKTAGVTKPGIYGVLFNWYQWQATAWNVYDNSVLSGLDTLVDLCATEAAAGRPLKLILRMTSPPVGGTDTSGAAIPNWMTAASGANNNNRPVRFWDMVTNDGGARNTHVPIHWDTSFQYQGNFIYHLTNAIQQLNTYLNGTTAAGNKRSTYILHVPVGAGLSDAGTEMSIGMGSGSASFATPTTINGTTYGNGTNGFPSIPDVSVVNRASAQTLMPASVAADTQNAQDRWFGNWWHNLDAPVGGLASGDGAWMQAIAAHVAQSNFDSSVAYGGIFADSYLRASDILSRNVQYLKTKLWTGQTNLRVRPPNGDFSQPINLWNYRNWSIPASDFMLEALSLVDPARPLMWFQTAASTGVGNQRGCPPSDFQQAVTDAISTYKVQEIETYLGQFTDATSGASNAAFANAQIAALQANSDAVANGGATRGELHVKNVTAVTNGPTGKNNLPQFCTDVWYRFVVDNLTTPSAITTLHFSKSSGTTGDLAIRLDTANHLVARWSGGAVDWTDTITLAIGDVVDIRHALNGATSGYAIYVNGILRHNNLTLSVDAGATITYGQIGIANASNAEIWLYRYGAASARMGTPKPLNAAVNSDAPSVAIVSPTDQQVFTTAGTKAVNVTAADNDNISAVEVSVDGGAWQLMTLNGSQYTTNVSLAGTAGTSVSHTIAVRATDAFADTLKRKQTTQTITVFVNIVGVDTQAPTLTVTTPSANATVANGVTSQNIVGNAIDNVAVASVTVNGVTQTLDASGNFATTVPLIIGSNTIKVIAKDAAGNTSTVTRTITRQDVVAFTPPTVTITNPSAGQTYPKGTRSITLAGTVVDADGIQTVTYNIDGSEEIPLPLTNGAFNQVVGVTPGNHTLTVTATNIHALTDSDARSVVIPLDDAANSGTGSTGVTQGQVIVRG